MSAACRAMLGGMETAIGQLAGLGGKTEKAIFAPAVSDFYQTNPIARASAVMAECSALAASSRARISAS